MSENFKKIVDLNVYGTLVKKYVSEVTGLSIVLANVDSPLVNGYFVLGTEAHDDFGLPHTLEHFVFLGSEDYPYKGVLDTLSNRCLAQGTNAWTDIDHTCYTISTAGEEGFLIILPIYLDHILYPTLTESAFYTEIHHVNGLGEDAGVVYCEMQGRENTAESLLFCKIQQTMYPAPCGYRQETGGIMKDLRALTSAQVRDYHRDYYRPDNLTIVVTGQVSESKLLKAVEPIERKIIEKGVRRMAQRPWLDSLAPAPFENKVVRIENFPDEQEVNGMVHICWRTREYCDFLTEHALDVAHDYLTDSAVSLLQQTFVEIDDPYCSGVDFDTIDNLSSLQVLTFSSVPVAKLEYIEPLFLSALKTELYVKGLDMERIKLTLKKAKQSVLAEMESDPHNFFSQLIIGAAIYGDLKGEQLVRSMRVLSILEELESWTLQEWQDFIARYFLDRPYYCQLGKPSTKMANQLQETERQRVEQQRKDLGPAKLAELAKRLEDMAELNDVPIPDSLIESFPIPKYQNVPMPVVLTGFSEGCAVEEGVAKNELQKRLEPLGASRSVPRIQCDHYSSGFVTVKLLADTSALNDELRLLLDIFLVGFFEIPVFDSRENRLYSHEEVVKGLLEDTVDFGAGLGEDGVAGSFQCGQFSQFAVVRIKVVAENYAKAIRWMDLLTHGQRWTAERIKIAANKVINDIPTVQRDGYNVLDASVRQALYSCSSNLRATTVISQSAASPNLLKQLEDPEQMVKKFNGLAELLFGNDDGLFVHVKGNLLELADLTDAWNQWKSKHPRSREGQHPKISLSQFHLSRLGKNLGEEHVVVNMPSIESSFAYHVVRGPCQFNDADLPSLLVVNEMLHTMEGYFWKGIRGNGLAYGASLHLLVESGFLALSIYRSTDASKAFEAAQKIVERLLESNSESSSSSSSSTGSCSSRSDIEETPSELRLDEIEFEAAKSSVAFSIIAQEETASRSATASFINQTLKKLPGSANRDLLLALEKVTIGDCFTILEKYFSPLFDSKSSFAAVVTNPGKLDDVKQGYKKCGFYLKSIE